MESILTPNQLEYGQKLDQFIRKLQILKADIKSFVESKEIISKLNNLKL